MNESLPTVLRVALHETGLRERANRVHSIEVITIYDILCL
jgi:hypothetical protein